MSQYAHAYEVVCKKNKVGTTRLLEGGREGEREEEERGEGGILLQAHCRSLPWSEHPAFEAAGGGGKTEKRRERKREREKVVLCCDDVPGIALRHEKGRSAHRHSVLGVKSVKSPSSLLGGRGA